MTVGPLEGAVCLEVLGVPSTGMQGELGVRRARTCTQSERLPEKRGEDLQGQGSVLKESRVSKV